MFTGEEMIDLKCGRDASELGIRTHEGWNITAFLDHLNGCSQCSESKELLIRELNKLIGGKQ